MMDLFQNPSLRSNKFRTSIWAAKVLLMSMGIISTLVLLKVAIIPYTFHLVLSTLPRLWVSARSMLSPTFVYIIINFIIITIVASSNFHHTKSPNFSDFSAPADPKYTTTNYAFLDTGTVTHPSEPESQSNETKEEEKEVEQEEAQLQDSVSAKSCNENSVTDPSPEKCADDNFSPDSDDTLEGTWRAIMEGQGKTTTHQLKKSDTWTARISKAEPFHDNGIGEGGDDDDPVAWAQRELRKSETFNDTVSLRRESMSPEEVNRKVEAFIKKFNNQMKLQRLESYQRSMEMVNRGL